MCASFRYYPRDCPKYPDYRDTLIFIIEFAVYSPCNSDVIRNEPHMVRGDISLSAPV